VAAVPAKTMRSGGNVADAEGAAVAPPEADAPGDGVTPEGSTVGEALARGLPLGVGDALTGIAVGGGGALGLGDGVGGGDDMSSSAAASRNVPSLVEAL
jgi:hypothetical protein